MNDLKLKNPNFINKNLNNPDLKKSNLLLLGLTFGLGIEKE